MSTPAYFDSSAILSMLFNDLNKQRALDAWAGASSRVSSKLLEFESYVTLNRTLLQTTSTVASEWGFNSKKWLVKMFGVITLFDINDRILAMIKNTPELAVCRTLDAIHIGTALVMREECANVRVVSFDKSLVQLATKLGFAVV